MSATIPATTDRNQRRTTMNDDLNEDIMLGAEAMVVLPWDQDLHLDDAEPSEPSDWARFRLNRGAGAAAVNGVDEEDVRIHEVIQRIFSVRPE
jgi:hypothetical protein